MNKQIEALKIAIEALDTLMMEKGSIYQQALNACKEALAEAEKQEWQSLSDCEINELDDILETIRDLDTDSAEKMLMEFKYKRVCINKLKD